MSEERRLLPIPDPLESAPSTPPLAAASPSSAPGPGSPPSDGATARVRMRDSSAGVRKRGRTLRIPDDEIVRPQPQRAEVARPRSEAPAPRTDSIPPRIEAAESTPPVAEVAELPVLTPLPIISINPEPGAPAAFDPYFGDHGGHDADSVEVRFDDEAPTPLLPSVSEAPPPAPIETSHVALPSDATDDPEDVADMGWSEAAPPTPVVAPRASEPADGELSADDLVAVDATPASPNVQADLPPMRARQPSPPPSPPPASKRTAPPQASAARSGRPPLVIVPPHIGTLAPPPAREGSGLRRKGRFWWEDLFNDDYLRATERLTEPQLLAEVDFVEDSLGIERGGAVLDLGCGTGRHAVELARRGYEVVGFDLSLAMLARASEEAQERSAKLNFVQGDMREMTFAEQFDGVYCWNTTFGYFEEEKNAQVIDRIHGALKAGGLFLLDVVNRDFVVRQSPSLAWFEGDGCVCMDEMVVDFITSRLKIKRTMMLDDGRAREIEYSMRVYALHELGKVLHEHGFKVCEVTGRIATPGVFLGHDSPRIIILAEKR